jgi:hypothetical protein
MHARAPCARVKISTRIFGLLMGGEDFKMLFSVCQKSTALGPPPKKNMGPTAPLKSSSLISHPGKAGS